MSNSLAVSDVFKVSFYATPHPYLLLNPNLTIIDANDCYLAATMTRRGDIKQVGMFDVFPDNPGDPGADGVANLGRSLTRVLDSGKLDRMECQRYDIRDAEGVYEERWWQPVNIPVFDERGHLAGIVHYVEDVTKAQRARLGRAPAGGLAGEAALAAAVENSLRDAETHIVGQKDIIEELRRKGHPTKVVENLLKSLEQVIVGHRTYAEKLRLVSRARTSHEIFYSQWSSAVADARAHLEQLDQVLNELRHQIWSSRHAVDESRSLIAEDPGRGTGNPK